MFILERCDETIKYFESFTAGVQDIIKKRDTWRKAMFADVQQVEWIASLVIGS